LGRSAAMSASLIPSVFSNKRPAYNASLIWCRPSYLTSGSYSTVYLEVWNQWIFPGSPFLMSVLSSDWINLPSISGTLLCYFIKLLCIHGNERRGIPAGLFLSLLCLQKIVYIHEMIKSAPYGKVCPFLSPLYICYVRSRHILYFSFLNVENCYSVPHYYVALGAKEHECFHQRQLINHRCTHRICKFSRNDITFHFFAQWFKSPFLTPRLHGDVHAHTPHHAHITYLQF
jgi:hypothetical protein